MWCILLRNAPVFRKKRRQPDAKQSSYGAKDLAKTIGATSFLVRTTSTMALGHWRTNLATETLMLSQVVHQVTEKRSPPVMLYSH